MPRASKFRFPFWKKAAQRSFRKLLRPLFLERLENRQLFDATNWTNPFQRFDVSGDVSQSVDPLDALLIINEINAPFYTSESNSRLPDLPASNRDPHPYFDVDCDGFVSPLDVLNVVNAINLGSHPAGWKYESDAANGLAGGFVSSASCGPKLHEGASFITQISTEVTIPLNATNLSFRISKPSFDTTSPTGMKDAFEAALVDQNGNTLVFPFSRNRDSFMNMSEGQVPVVAPGVKVTGDKIEVNVSQIPAGTVAKLLVRLVNNDRDTQTNAGVSELEIATNGIGVPFGTASPESTSSIDRRNGIDFSHFSNVTGSLVAQYGRTSHFDDPQILYSDLAIRNNGSYSTKTPMLLVLKNFSDPSVHVRNADGTTPDGDPYFDFSTLVTDGTLSPDETTASRNVTFYNPSQTQFTYEIAVLSELNKAPLFSSEPDVEALVDKVYTYDATASDLDGDKLSFSILSGPAGMTVDSDSGTVTWQPNSSHLGNQSITLRVDDGQGAYAEQHFTLAVIVTPPNRPPVFSSTPVVSANFNTPYMYDANARDEDGDALSYSLVAGAEGMSVDKATGAVSWIPNGSLGTAQEKAYTSIDISPFANLKLSDLANTTPNYPTGSFQPFGVPFFIPPFVQNVWHSQLASGTNPRVLEIPVSVTGATAVHTLINTYWGQGGPASYAYAEFFGSGGAYFRKNLIGNEDIRDYLQNRYTNQINGSSSRAAFSEGSVRLDVQRIALPPAFLGQTLESIRLVDNGGDQFQRIFVSGVTVESSFDAMAKRPVTIAVEDGRGGSATQNFVIDIQPAVGNHAPIFVSEPVTEAFVTDPSTVGIPVDLSKWSVVQYPVGGQGPAEWVLEQNNTVARQRKNADPSILVSDFNFSNDQMRGGFRADLPVADDDFMGFVFGYQDQQHYYLFDWKKATQSNGASGLAQVGMSVKIVDADAPLTVRDLWNTDTAGAQVRTIYHNSIPWEFGVDYDFSLVFHPGQFSIVVSRGATTLAEIQLQDSTYSTGKFGFYNFSQGPVSYSGFRHQIAPSYAYQFEALDPDGDALTYRLVDGPVGMIVTPNTNQITWTPGAAAVGSHDVVLQADDGRGGLDVQKFAIRVTDVGGAEIRGQTLLEPPVPALPQVNTTLTADNRYALFYGAADGSSLNFVGQDDDEWEAPESFLFNPGQGDYIYVVGWDFGSVNMFIGDFLINDTQRVVTNSTDWEYVIGKGANPGTSYDPPPLSTLQLDIASGSWKTPQISEAQPAGWGTFAPAISSQARFIWADTFSSGSASAESYVIFRIKTPVPAVQPGLPNFTVYLDQNNNDQRDPGERFTTTDSQGNYAFKGLLPAKYSVAQIAQPGWKQTQPASGTSTVDLATGQIADGVNFSYVRSTVAEIRGTKFHDLNGEGVRSLANRTVSANVPGYSDPWLAGMPNGSTASSGDIAPAHSPTHVAELNLIPGTALTFQASGSVNFIPAPSGTNPDGDRNNFLVHSDGAQNGIANITAPMSSLVAIFLGPDQPNLTPAPSSLNFQSTGNVVGGLDYLTLSPQLKQVFFVGDGQTSNGQKQQIIVPEGATRLFLGTMDSYGWRDNWGAFAVNVTAVQPEPGLRNWTIYLDQNTNGVLDSNEPSTLTDTKGEYAFTNLTPGTYVVAEVPYPTYNAVSDFTTTENPNSPWTYGYSQTRGSTFQQSTISGVTTTLDYWSATTSGPHITHNLTGSTIPGGITYPPDALNLDPSFDGRNSVLRFTAPVTDTYRVTGRFQGIDLTRGSTTDVAILQNSNSILTGNINGFFTDLATTPGAIVPYDLQVTLQQGETLDFSVGQGTGGSLFDSTGVSAIITGKNWRQTAPLTKTHPISVVAGEVRKNVDFGNLELAAQPLENNSPQITSTAVTESGVGARYRVTATATDVDGDRLTFDLPVKPSGMTVDPSTGILVWTPTADQAGVQNVILRVSDGRGGVDLQSFQVTVASRNSGPTITSRPLGPAIANLPYQYRIRAQDAEGDAIEYSLNTPAIGNMTVDSVTGVFSWLPSSNDIGSHTIEVTATDSSGDGQLQRFTLAVLATAPNREPQILSTPRDQVRLGSSYMYAVDAMDPDGDPLAYRVDVALSEMTIDVNGVITWTPSATQFGNNPVQVSVSDGRGGVRVQAFNISVLSKSENHAPVIDSTPTLAATVGLRYRYDVKATDEDGDTLAFSLDTKPTGMSIDALTGAIRWIPTADQLGAQPIVVRVTDTQGSTATQSLTVTVRGSNLAPEISSVPKTIAAVGRAYSYVLKATDPEGGPLTYSLSKKSGNMVIDSSGTIQWVPGAGEVGNVNVTVRVGDVQGASVEQSFTVVVAAAAPNAPPIITSQPNLGATVGQRYQYQVTATDPEGGAVRFAFLEVPNGMTIDESTGLIQWTSDAAGIGRVTVLVGDFDGGEAEQSFEVTVRSTNVAPQISSTPVVNTAAGVTYRYDVRANDPNFDPLTFALVTGPVGMTMDNLGRITWSTAIADAGTHRVKFTVSDDRGASASQEYDLVVTADTEAPKVRIQVDSNPVGLNETLTIQVNASDNTGVKTLDVTVDGKAISLDARGRASVLMTQVGTIRIAAVATDAAGNVGRQTMDVKVVDTSVTGSPTVDVTIPAENATITAPTDVIGTVQDPNLVSWKLEVAPFDGGDFKQIATGMNQITNGKIATFDPTMLQNDSYILRLTARNTGGLSSSIDTVVNVSGNLKLGNFTLSFTDLSIPVAGIPITVARTYDTLNANQDGELGYGWKLAFRDVDLRTSLPKTGDEAGGLYTPFRDGTRVYITLPGGQRQGFTFRPKAVALFDPNQRERDVGPEYQPGNGLNAAYFVPSFVPDKGVTNKLSVRRYQLTKKDHEYFQFGGGLPFNPEDPSFGGQFTLTTKDGTSLRIDASTKKLTTVNDRDGHFLTFTEDQIQSSTGTLVSFIRDLNGRIREVKDPMGSSVRYEYSDEGDLISVKDRSGATTRLEYLKSVVPHYLSRVVDPLGNNGIRSEYDNSGRLVAVVGPTGSRVATELNMSSLSEKIADPLGNVTSYTYDDRGNTVMQANPDGAVIHRKFDQENRVLSETMALEGGINLTTSYEYDSDGNRVSEKDPLGNVSRQIYGPFSQLLSETDSNGNTTAFKYDATGRLTAVKDPLGNLSVFQYDSKGNLVSEAVDGRTITSSYDASGRMTRQEDGTGGTDTYSYDVNGNVLSKIRSIPDSTGNKSFATTYVYDANGRVLMETDPLGGVVRNEFDAAGNRTATITSSGRTEYLYDARGNVIETRLPDATPTDPTDNPRNKSEFNAAGREVSRTDALGRVTAFTYDPMGRLTATIYPDNTPADSSDNPRTQTTYDLAGRTIAEIDEGGNRTEFSYDAAGRRISSRDALGRVGSSSFDSVGRLISSTDPKGRTTLFAYDAGGRLFQTIYADGTRTLNGFDKTGRPSERTDELGRVTTREFDLAGRLIAVITPQGERTEYKYNAAGNLISQTDAAQNVTSYEYDDRGYRTATILPLGQRSETTFDVSGRATRQSSFSGSFNSFSYDQLGHLTQTTYADGTSTSFTYTSTGQRASATDSRGTTQYRYDERDRLIAQFEPDGTKIAYTYDSVGNQTSIQTPVGTTKKTYSKLNQLDSITDPAGGITRYNYDEMGNLVRTEFPNGTFETRKYDLRDRLTSIETRDRDNVVLKSFQYKNALNGMRDSVTDANGQTTHYSYDDDDRLTKEVISHNGNQLRVITYTYDVVGNRRTMTDSSSGTKTYTYDANDRLLQETLGNEQTAYSYDENGNLLAVEKPGEVVRYKWNASGRLAAADINGDGNDDIINVYNTDMVRVAQRKNGLETRYLVDSTAENPQVAIEYRPNGLIVASYVFGNSLISQDLDGSVSYYVVDGLGSTRALTEQFGRITDNFDYDSFGQMTARTGTTPAEYLYAGQQRDSDLKLDYLRSRYYDPGTGRFVSRDTFPGQTSNPITMHRYIYGNANPVNFTDPSGNFGLLNYLPAINLQLVLYTTALTTTSAGLVGGGLGLGVDLYGGGSTLSSASKAFAEGAWAGAKRGFLGGLILSALGPAVATGVGGGAIGGAAASSASGGLSEFLVQVYDYERGNIDEFSITNIALATSVPFLLGAKFLRPGVQTKQRVANWTAEGVANKLEPGRWVMVGGKTRSNYFQAGLGFGKFQYPFDAGRVRIVDGKFLDYPGGWEVIKGLIGQRIYNGPPRVPK